MVVEILTGLIKLILSVAVGTIIGSERHKHGKPVGRRTMSLVAIGATLATISAIKYFESDTARVVAGILTGIGFLGAGAIIGEGKQVIGLTTAASIWAVSIIGVAIGLGEYIMALIALILVYLVLVLHIDKEVIKS